VCRAHHELAELVVSSKFEVRIERLARLSETNLQRKRMIFYMITF